jgi:tetratricopeptide (TPR) repeat protein
MLQLCQETGSQGGIARALGDLGIDAYGLQQYENALELFEQSLAIYRDIGNAVGINDALGDIAETLNAMGAHAQAQRYAHEALQALPDGQVDWRCGSWEYRILGNAACGLGNYVEAKRYLHKSMDLAASAHLPSRQPLALVGVSRVLAKEGESERALELLALVMTHRMSWQMAKDQAAPLIEELKAELPPEAVAAAWERGQARDLDATVAELLVELGEEKVA